MAIRTYAAADVAKFFLASADPEGNDVSNLKLQKLCYYAQGIVSSMGGLPLFSESIFAWDHGPVVESLYHSYKDNRNQPIAAVEDFDATMFDHRDRAALSDIAKYYGQFSAWALRNMTHEEKPWLDAYNRAQGAEIPVQSLIDFFKPQIDDEYVKKLYGEAIQARP